MNIVIGTLPNEQIFPVYKDFLVHYSPIFASGFASTPDCHTVTFAETDPETFGHLLHWIYTQNLPLEARGCSYKHLVLLSGVWELGSRFLISGLQNASMKLIHSVLYNNSLMDEEKPMLKAFVDAAFAKLEKESGEVLLTKMMELAVHKLAFGIPGEALKEAGERGHISSVVVGLVLKELREGIGERDMGNPEFYYVESQP